MAVLTAALVLPVAGIAAPSTTAPSNGPSGNTVIAAGLLAQAQANPGKQFNVIITSARGRSSGDAASAFNSNASGNDRTKRNFTRLSSLSVSLSGSTLLKLAKFPMLGKLVQSIVPDVKLKVADYQNSEMWRQTIGADKLWSHRAVTCATNALGLQLDPTCIPTPAFLAPQAPAIAIVDSGIDATKAADFGSRVIARQDFVTSDNGVDPGGDLEGHGTMVAGVAAGSSALYPGVAQNAPLVDARVAGADGSIQMSDVLAALNWILANKDKYNIKVVNMSLTGNGEASVETDPIDQAVEKLWLSGVVVVSASGNHGQPDSAVKLSSPGNDPFIITVGATGVNGTADPSDDTRAPWSAYGTTADGFSKPDLVAPGRFIVAPTPTNGYLVSMEPDRVPAAGYLWMSGTSFASPMVAGAAAQILARHPDFTPDQVKGALLSTASSIADKVGTGAGELNAAAAAAVTSPSNPNAALAPFVTSSAGVPTFDAVAWGNAATQSGWTMSGWTMSGWTESGWTESGWTESGWTESGWTESGWVE